MVEQQLLAIKLAQKSDDEKVKGAVKQLQAVIQSLNAAKQQ